MRALLLFCVVLMGANTIDDTYYAGKYKRAADDVGRNIIRAILVQLRSQSGMRRKHGSGSSRTPGSLQPARPGLISGPWSEPVISHKCRSVSQYLTSVALPRTQQYIFHASHLAEWPAVCRAAGLAASLVIICLLPGGCFGPKHPDPSRYEYR